MSEGVLSFGCCPDPDDAFMYAALGKGAIDMEGLTLRVVEAEQQDLLEQAKQRKLDATVLPVYGYGLVADAYRPLESGASAAETEGPLIVSNRTFIEAEFDATTTVHVPGLHSTATLVLKLYSPVCSTIAMPMATILPAIEKHEIETGLVIDQGILAFADMGLYRVEDLGEWWYFNSGHLPLVMTIVAVRRDLPEETQRKLARVVRRSVSYAVEHQDQVIADAKRHARGVSNWILDKFVTMYVNQRSLALDEASRKSCAELHARAVKAGLLEKAAPFDFVPST